jgi:hypothetical protein
MKSVTHLRTSLLATTILVLGAVGFVTFVGGQAEESSQGPASTRSLNEASISSGSWAAMTATPWKWVTRSEPDMTRFLSGHPEAIGPLPKTATAAPFV